MIRIKLYTSPTCLHCKEVKLKIEELGIEYEELNAFEHKEELDGLELPIIKLGGKEIDLDELINFKWVTDNHKLCP